MCKVPVWNIKANRLDVLFNDTCTLLSVRTPWPRDIPLHGSGRCDQALKPALLSLVICLHYVFSTYLLDSGKQPDLQDIYSYVTHGKGLLGSQDDYNRKHRRLCQPPFSQRSQLERFADVVTSRAADVVAVFSRHLQQQGALQTDMANQMQRLTLDIVGLTAFSHDFRQVERMRRDMAGKANEGELTDRVLWAVNTFGEVLAKVFVTPRPLLELLDRLPLGAMADLRLAVSTMKEAMLDVIAERRKRLANGLPGEPDLLGILLEAEDEDGSRLTDEELWEDVHDIMGAGHETTATTTAATLYNIAAHPAVEAKAVAELQRVLGGRAPAYSDLERLPYLSQCVKETLRMYPAIPVFPREAAEADVLPSGHAVQRGDVVFMSSFSLGRSDSIWRAPMTYDPDRFGPGNADSIHKFQYLPFGAGPRMCLGPSFAMMSVTLMVATMLQSFRFKPLEPRGKTIPVEYDITMNFNKTRGLKMEVLQRE